MVPRFESPQLHQGDLHISQTSQWLGAFLRQLRLAAEPQFVETSFHLADALLVIVAAPESNCGRQDVDDDERGDPGNRRREDIGIVQRFDHELDVALARQR